MLSGGMWSRGCLVAALWSPVSGPYSIWVAAQEMPFLMKNVNSKRLGHFFLWDTVTEIGRVHRQCGNAFSQDMSTWSIEILSLALMGRNADLSLRKNLPDCLGMLAWHCICTSFPNNSKKLSPKYRICNNTL